MWWRKREKRTAATSDLWSKTTFYIYFVCDPWSDLFASPTSTHTHTHFVLSCRFCPQVVRQQLKMSRVNITSRCVCIHVGETCSMVVERVQTCASVCERERRVLRCRRRSQSWNIYISLWRAEESWLERAGGGGGGRRDGQIKSPERRGDKEENKDAGKTAGVVWRWGDRWPRHGDRRLSLPWGCEQMLVVTLDVGFIGIHRWWLVVSTLVCVQPH